MSRNGPLTKRQKLLILAIWNDPGYQPGIHECKTVNQLEARGLLIHRSFNTWKLSESMKAFVNSNSFSI